MNIHPPPRRINTFTHPAETDIVNFTPSGNINGMINRSRHTRRKQTLSTLFQLEVTSNTPRLTRSLSADSDFSILFQPLRTEAHTAPPEAPTVTLGGFRHYNSASNPSGRHSRRIQTHQPTLQPSLSAETDTWFYPAYFFTAVGTSGGSGSGHGSVCLLL